MAEYFEVHPETPQPRRIKQAVEIVRKGGVIAYPTDSSYALGCHIGDKKAMDKIRRIRRVDDKHNFTLVCRDLSELSLYAKVDNSTYRLLKAHTPGAYTFILQASKEVPRRLQNPKRKTIGLRVPDHPVALALLEELNEPLMSSTLILPGEEQPESIAWEIKEKLDHELDAILDGGWCGIEPTTVVDLTSGEPVIARHGLGDPSPFE